MFSFSLTELLVLFVYALFLAIPIAAILFVIRRLLQVDQTKKRLSQLEKSIGNHSNNVEQ